MTNTKNQNALVYWMQSAYMAGVRCHPQTDMKNLGIKYYDADVNTVADYWVFFVDEVPCDLPEYITHRVVCDYKKYGGLNG